MDAILTIYGIVALAVLADVLMQVERQDLEQLGWFNTALIVLLAAALWPIHIWELLIGSNSNRRR